MGRRESQINRTEAPRFYSLAQTFPSNGVRSGNANGLPYAVGGIEMNERALTIRTVENSDFVPI